MPKPSFAKPKKKPVGKSKTNSKPKNTALSTAREAVEKYESEYAELQEMKTDWAGRHPDAAKELMGIRMQEDLVNEAVKEAHVAVQQAKESVGPFKCSRRWAAAGYNKDDFTKICGSLDDPSVIIQLIAEGVIKAIVPDNGTRSSAGKAVTFLAQHPELAELFLSAWEDEVEKTPAVTDPKI